MSNILEKNERAEDVTYGSQLVEELTIGPRIVYRRWKDRLKIKTYNTADFNKSVYLYLNIYSDFYLKDYKKKLVGNYDSTGVFETILPRLEYCYEMFGDVLFGTYNNNYPVDILELPDTSRVKSMSYMFSGYSDDYDSHKSRLRYINLDGFDTSNVTTISGMFRDCGLLENLDMSGCDVSKLTDMSHAFQNCTSLTDLDLTDWNSSELTNMYFAFENCTSLTDLDLSSWDVSKLTNMSCAFENCTSLTVLDLSGWDVSKLTNMSFAFRNCTSLTNINLSGWNISSNINIIRAFENCTSLTEIDMSGCNFLNMNNYWGVFTNCSNLQTLKIGMMTFSANDTGGVFNGCSNLQTLSGTFDFTNYNISYMINENVPALTNISGQLTIKDSGSLRYQPLLTNDSAMVVINGLVDVGATKSMQFHKTVYQSLTDEQIAVATAKGWTITST